MGMRIRLGRVDLTLLSDLNIGSIMVDFIFFLSFFFQAEDGIRDLVRSRGLGDVYKRQQMTFGFSRDDVEAKMMPAYVAQGLLPGDPFDSVAVSYTHLTLPTIYSV